MRWHLSHRADPVARRIADRHYNRQKPGTSQFVPPGRCIVLTAGNPPKALWVSSTQQFAKHAWPGAWVCTAFRNEGAGLSSELVREAVAATVALWGPPPEAGFLTFVDRTQVRPKRDWGRCYRKAGWKAAGETQGGLVALTLAPSDFPPASPPLPPRLASTRSIHSRKVARPERPLGGAE